jgi:predicted GNAT superfamily acetyltransferase
VIRDLGSVADCHEIVELQRVVWGDDAETVPASLLLVSARHGGILLGASWRDRLMGFVWSMPAWRPDRVPAHWSHLLAVHPEARGHGLGAHLKVAQRARAMAQGVELIEWTFDPLQAANAHLNVTRLGATSASYAVDLYGPMHGVLHRGTPTDRLVAEWHLRQPHVERRLARIAAGEGAPPALVAWDASVTRAPELVAVGREGAWVSCRGVETVPDASRLTLAVPPNFTAMQQQAPEVAAAWRLGAREAFTTAFAHGYRVVDFFLDREQGGGRYLLARPEAAASPSSDGSDGRSG